MAIEIRDIVILKDGSTINGEVLVEKFVLKMKFGTLEIIKPDIRTIIYKNPSYSDDDEVHINTGARLHGDLGPTVIRIRFEDTNQVLEIPKTDIHSLVFFIRRGKVSAATRKALKSVS